jgi:2-phosphoglycolate phosphatase
MPIRIILFDFDGTLADSYRAITASVNHVRAAHGLPPLAVEEVRPTVGRGLPQLLARCVPGTDLEIDSRRYREHHPSVLETGTELLPGAYQTLDMLHKSGYSLGICSNKPVAFTRTLVRLLRIESMLTLVIGPDDVPRPKPAPDMLVEALARSKATPSEAVYVGDMSVDVQTARAAGLTVWVIPTGSETRTELEAAGPDRILASLAEIPNLLANTGER